jgi:hypothetical protein
MPNLDSNATTRAVPRVKTPARLSEPLSRGLNAYAFAAAAAGVAAIACAMPAEGAPVCKDLSAKLLATNTLPLNPAEQAVAPFNIAQTTMSYFLSTTGISQFIWWNRGFFVPNSAGAKVLLGAKNVPANVASGAEIGPGGQFGKGASYGVLFTYGRGNFSHIQGGGTKLKHRGNLSLVQDNYIGFQFSESGQAHYGWVRLRVTFQNPPQTHTVIHVLGLGYESAPNTAIAAGSCSGSEKEKAGARPSDFRGASLGMLALGSEGVRSWRRPSF